MKLGGSSHLGSGAMGGDPFGHYPGHVCDRIIAALSRFKMVDGVGVVHTIRRLSGDLADQAQLDRHLLGGVPAYLVWYQGGNYIAENTSRTTFRYVATYSVICIAGDWQNKQERQEGRNRYEPSTDNMLQWAAYYVTRELQNIHGVRMARPVNVSFIRWLAGQYIGKIDFEVWSDQSLLDDDDGLSNTLERLGIVHNPLDLGQLFEPNNETPNSDEPVGGGVFGLEG